MTMEVLFFYVFGAVALASATYVILARNPVYSAMSLVVTVLSLAGIYVLLNAHFLAAVQVLVYAGAIMVLFLFVIMLLNLSEEELGKPRITFFKVLGTILTLGVMVQVIGMILSSDRPVAGGARQVMSGQLNAPGGSEWGGIQDVGVALFESYLLPFEVVSILLLVAMIGALHIARKRTA
ncbi:MAG: NADH-quinone oxidoreductase subunit J [Myxococcales bacterium]|nr:NADH-quinone oxidoreductase subunit J [Myxococcales bacterium]